MEQIRTYILVVSLIGYLSLAGAHAAPTQLPPPEVNDDSWVMIEIFPTVDDITLSAYFLDFSYDKNQNLCTATKRVFDRDQEAKAKESGKEFTSYRRCMSVNDAKSQGYIRAR